jgi:hypothetical protein
MGYRVSGWHIECSAMAQMYLGDYSAFTAAAKITSVHHTNDRRPRPASARGWPTSGCTGISCFERQDAKSAGEFLRLQSLIDRGTIRWRTAICT